MEEHSCHESNTSDVHRDEEKGTTEERTYELQFTEEMEADMEIAEATLTVSDHPMVSENPDSKVALTRRSISRADIEELREEVARLREMANSTPGPNIGVDVHINVGVEVPQSGSSTGPSTTKPVALSLPTPSVSIALRDEKKRPPPPVLLTVAASKGRELERAGSHALSEVIEGSEQRDVQDVDSYSGKDSVANSSSVPGSARSNSGVYSTSGQENGPALNLRDSGSSVPREFGNRPGLSVQSLQSIQDQEEVCGPRPCDGKEPCGGQHCCSRPMPRDVPFSSRAHPKVSSACPRCCRSAVQGSVSVMLNVLRQYDREGLERLLRSEDEHCDVAEEVWWVISNYDAEDEGSASTLLERLRNTPQQVPLPPPTPSRGYSCHDENDQSRANQSIKDDLRKPLAPLPWQSLKENGPNMLGQISTPKEAALQQGSTTRPFALLR
mmetsp:Transcript_12613/g.27848  ORF Transcript_12613/g.27848 Transcript_12613/m.27848 type:complete len:441 (+) Transcript_12613:1193-2515(+)